MSIERAGQSLRGDRGARLQDADVVRTGNDGSVGITMTDNSLLSAGPNSVLALDRYEFDSTTNAGRFDASLQRGTLAVVSGRLAKQSLRRDDGAHTVRDPRRARHRIRRLGPMTSAVRAACLVAAIALAAALAGCASRTERIVLLPEQDGRPTALVVKQGAREVRLDQPYAATELT